MLFRVFLMLVSNESWGPPWRRFNVHCNISTSCTPKNLCFIDGILWEDTITVGIYRLSATNLLAIKWDLLYYRNSVKLLIKLAHHQLYVQCHLLLFHLFCLGFLNISFVFINCIFILYMTNSKARMYMYNSMWQCLTLKSPHDVQR